MVSAVLGWALQEAVSELRISGQVFGIWERSPSSLVFHPDGLWSPPTPAMLQIQN